MTDMKQTKHQTLVTKLNSTPLSQHLASLLKCHGGKWLTIKSLAYWVTENCPEKLNQDPQDIEQRLALWEMDNPQSLYDNLEDPMLQEASTLDQAGMVMLDILNEIFVPIWVRDANLDR